jgi:hypothetical protein
MDISECIINKECITFCIGNNYELIDSTYKNPIFPYKINYKSKTRKLTYCGNDVIDSWCLQLEDSFTFYFIVKKNSNVLKSIVKKFGTPDAETYVEMNGIPSPTAYHWDEEVKIILSRYLNPRCISKYNDCFMITFGNMEFSRIVHLPDK